MISCHAPAAAARAYPSCTDQAAAAAERVSSSQTLGRGRGGEGEAARPVAAGPEEVQVRGVVEVFDGGAAALLRGGERGGTTRRRRRHPHTRAAGSRRN